MNALSISVPTEICQSGSDFSVTRWYAVYTRSRYEKTVARELAGKGMESFSPMFESIRMWKNGRHLVRLPLFPSYAFVRIALADQMAVLKVPGVVRLVGFGGAPVPLPEGEVESLRRVLTEGVRAEPYPFLATGRRVRITTGSLAGREGFLVRRKRGLRVVLSSELMQRSILLEVNASDVEPVKYVAESVSRSARDLT